jgi:autotransporter-associated beta strand protein
MTGGDTSGTNAGTFSIVNLRNNSGGDTKLGNNVRMAGTGYAYFNMLGSSGAGSKTSLGELQIGDGQVVAAVATGSAAFTLDFATVKLTGGNATFVPQLPGNANYVSVENINLGPISETVPNSGITMAGAATLSISGISTYTGPTVVSSGTLVVSGSIAGSSFTVPGGTLSGNGTTGPVELNGGTIAPGGGPVVLNTKALTLTSGTLAIEILSNGLGDGLNGYDQVNVLGAVKLNGPIALTLDFFNYDPVDGVDRFTIVENDLADAVTFGSADSRLTYQGVVLNEGTQFTATSGAFTQNFRLTYAGGTGNDIVLQAIPEPQAWLTLGTALAGLLGSRRRRR